MAKSTGGTTLRERARIRRTAADDARHRLPVPSSTCRVSTPYRESLWDLRDSRIGVITEAVEDQLLAPKSAARRAAEELKALGERLREAAEALTKVEAEQVDTSLRRRGDRGLSDEAVAARRTGAHDRRVAKLRSARLALENRALALRREIAELEEQVAGVRRVAAQQAHRVHLEQLFRRSLYDRALLRKHPQRKVIAALLDPDPRPLPGWVVTALADEADEQETKEQQS